MIEPNNMADVVTDTDISMPLDTAKFINRVAFHFINDPNFITKRGQHLTEKQRHWLYHFEVNARESVN